MNQCDLLKFLERNVTIEVSNRTRDVTLYSPRIYCFSGYCSTPPSPRIPPEATESCQFSNSILLLRGCVGLLVYEAETFTLAILFSNPFDYNLFSMELAMEISSSKVHLKDLEDIYERMYDDEVANPDEASSFHHVKIGACQEPVTVSSGHVKVMATMSNSTKSTIKVMVMNEDLPVARRVGDAPDPLLSPRGD